MIEDTLNKPKNGENNQDLVEMLKDLGARCRTCAPLNPLECVTRCNLWKLKNELRQLRDTMDDPNFIKELFNVLKNNTRLHILLTIVKGRHSISRLQEELKKAGYSHSCDTISQEYLQPLMQVGLAAEAQEQYYATTFGGKLTDVLEEFSDFVDVLPAHSECYEETLLDDNAQNLEGSAFINNTSPLGELQVSHSSADFAGFVLIEKGSLLNDTRCNRIHIYFTSLLHYFKQNMV